MPSRNRLTSSITVTIRNAGAGGQKSVYQHVDVLNENGYEAFVVHAEPGYQLRWFDNSTRLICAAEFRAAFDPQRDCLVLPEDMGSRIMLFPGNKVVFNRNLFYGFYAIGQKPSNSDPYLSQDVVAVMTVSDHNYRNFRFAYPHLAVRGRSRFFQMAESIAKIPAILLGSESKR